MSAREISREEWPRFLDEFSRAHAGWLVTVEERAPDGATRELVREVPLSGVSTELYRGQTRGIEIIAGPRDAEWTHRIAAPARLLLNLTPEGGEEGIETESADGLRTIIRFRSAIPPELVDGVAPER
jgi:hypothetical protein